MSSPALRYAFRTLLGPWAVLPVVVLEVMNFLQRGMPWRGESLWTVDWFAIALFVVGPLLAGAAAVDASRLSKAGNIHLVLATARPHRPYLRAAAWCAVPVLCVHLLTLAVGLAVSGIHGSPQWFVLAGAVLVQCLAICWYVAIGSAVGRLAGPLPAGAAAAVGAFSLLYLLGEGSTGRFEPLALGGATVSRLGYQYAPGYLLSQIAVFTLTGAVLLLLPLHLRSGRRLPTRAGAGALVLAAVFVVGGQYAFPGQRLTEQAESPDSCTGSAPVVCVYAEHRRFQNETVRHVQTLSAAARSRGYRALVPDRVEELSRSYRVRTPGTAGLELPADAYVSGRVALKDVASGLVRPLHCPALYEEPGPGPAYWQREFSLYATLLNTAGITVDPREFPEPARPLTPKEVQDIKDDYATCDLEGT
ncbi:hypothetical protein GCM10010329_37450 [Streptomyces spiroverticillatus]|uniref:Uncharacterized protein n=1 Tax=Streptomyces finlayi TaxID=67296 RepID=A0A918WYA7_9ACTN|nr:hypothetical protein [Streptomyces finlayi]GHA11079.1 hypothetical protein GCM10010329_37450 [Streptomyces spiroverticillatus]GHC95183.1 hypothetical protein GCM10010334_34160 [Streptomyces finlayi]